jgi:hypothetical protein
VGGHCQNIIMGWLAGDGHCITKYLGGGTQGMATARILSWADGQWMATVLQNI